MANVPFESYFNDGELPPGFPGMEVDLGPKDIFNKVNEDAAVIAHGVAVVRGATDKTCKIAGATTDSPLGISVRHNVPSAGVNGVPGYGRYAAVPIMAKGRIWVTAYENVTRGAPVFARVSDGALGVTNTGLALPNCVWDTTTFATNLGIVKMNLA